ncbi:MAG TPA: ATP-binding protein [Methanoregulaceae archaeon]|nr:ATP-binding protein [Methanoregulaceae archaeon]HPD10649.1 ATP-binding protein [Methanoregulaceae archaeon]HRT15779.1 ATP-binding protein [Methanoregulaceae archaeon]HRU31293.1 ATP-binding protein [Methanoregulaceae archaeon]
MRELTVEELRNRYDSKLVECKTTAELQPLSEIIGQKRAIKALDFGLNIPEKWFNVFVSGIHGTGRKTAVLKFLDELAKTKPKGNDWVYVNNFGNPYVPNAISLPPGKGKEFQEDMAIFISEAKRIIPKIFESEDYSAKREAVIHGIEEERAQLFAWINESANTKGFIVKPGPEGLLTIPVKNGKPLQQEEFQALPGEEQAEFQEKRQELLADLRTMYRKVRDLDEKEQEAVDSLNQEVALNATGHRVAVLKDKYHGIDPLLTYIESVQKDIVDNLPQFIPESPQQHPAGQVQQQLQHPLVRELVFRKYEVNVIVDNSGLMGAPVVFEQNPTYQNLFGKIEKEVEFGVVTTDFTMIRPGAIHMANGGYLVIMAEDLLRNQFSWDGLKTALKTGKVIIEEPGERMGFIAAKGIKPDPIPLSVKVVLIGTPLINQMLYTQDPDFSELFKVKAEFDTVMDRTEENARQYASFICTLCRESNLKHLDSPAVAQIIEYGSRLANDQQKLSTRFSLVSDIIREAGYYATMEHAENTTKEHVEKAIEEKLYRSALIQEKIQEFITRGFFLIDTEGERVGQINGLSVMSGGDIEFGRPSRVTASIGVGRSGIMDIEREAALGGPTHTKGVLILAGYMNNKYAQDKPLSLSARLVFEQSYEGVDGDSASSTELYSILSALSGLPVNQAIAVTGSVNQKGDIQAIGGVNEKIEGYFEVCKARGLTGKQGVMIPASNVQNLMRKEEILEAAKNKKFAIYTVNTIDEGIEVLTGVKAGTRQQDGTFEKDTVNYMVNQRLEEMAETIKEYPAALK